MSHVANGGEHGLSIETHPEADSLTASEIREVIVDAEQNLKLAREMGDELLTVWFTQEIRSLEAGLARRNGNARAGQPPKEKSPITICMSDVQREEVTWLWKNRIPLRKLTIIQGDPGVGKSQLTLAITAPVTRGLPIHGDTAGREPATVLILSAEDGLADTIRPRLEALGADLSKVIALTGMRDEQGHERAISLADVDILDAAIQQYKPLLVIIDPLIAYVGKVDTYKAGEVRGILAPLAGLAERHTSAVVAVQHLNKGAAKAVYRGQGSIDFFAACRSCFLVGKSPESDSEKVLISIKSNLGPEMPALTFSINGGRFEWGHQSAVTAEQLLADPVNDEEKSQSDEATEFLTTTLAKGPIASRDIIKAARDNGISERTLWRGKKRLGVKARKSGFTGAWEWALPAEGCQFHAKSAMSATLAELADLADMGDSEAAEWVEVAK